MVSSMQEQILQNSFSRPMMSEADQNRLIDKIRKKNKSISEFDPD